MAEDHHVDVSPIGSTAVAAHRHRTANNLAYAREWGARALAREIAWQLIRYRMDNDLTQEELAQRTGTSHSQITRIESGRHLPSVTSLGKIAAALDLTLRIVLEPRDDITPPDPRAAAD